MQEKTLSELDSYNPDALIDYLQSQLDVKNDFGLAKKLKLSPASISKIRHRVTPVTADTLLTMHDVSGLTIKELRVLMGDSRKFF